MQLPGGVASKTSFGDGAHKISGYGGVSISGMTSPVTEAIGLLIDEFVIEARNAAATAEVVDRNPQALSSAILAKAGSAERILFAPPQVMSPELFAPFTADGRVITQPDSEQMVNSAVGVTEALAGVARTGSVCVDVNYGRTGIVSLLAPLHIAVLAAENIVPRLRDVFRPDVMDGEGLTRDFVFITGPSATADMGPLVRGVHGPHRLHVIVVR
jgi:L-lactate dehydrogenase complex protein LldG